MSEDEVEIRNLVARWHAATAAGDVAAVLGLMTDDVVFLMPGREPMGKGEFAELMRLPTGVPRPSIVPTQRIREMEVVGDVAYMWTSLSVVVTPPGSTTSMEREGHTLTVFRKTEGKWMLARDANLLVTKSGQR